MQYETEERVLAGLGQYALPSEIALRGIVVAAHPDDEVIGAGARLARWTDVRVVDVTDGAPRDMRDAAALGIVRREDYAALRSAERQHALELADVGLSRTHDLGYVDNEACNDLVRLTTDLCALFRATTPDVVVTHAYEGGHPDHDATAFAVHGAAQLLMANGLPSPTIVEMTSYHRGPTGIATGCFLPVIERTAYETLLDESTRRLKRRMLDCHASQRKVLRQFRCDMEPIRVAPRYDFEVPPHEGRLFYEHFDWWVHGAEWRARAREATRALGLTKQRELQS